MDRVTRSYLDEFRAEQALDLAMEESKLFEHFANYCVVSSSHEEEFDITDVHCGGPDDLGLDGIAIIVNGVLVQSADECDDLLQVNGFLDVRFLMVQAKTSSNFSGPEMMAFCDGVDEFFVDTPTLPANPSVQRAREIMTWIYANGVKFRRQKPQLELSYVTTGRWEEDNFLRIKIAKRESDLTKLGLFQTVAFTPLGADDIQHAYQQAKNNITVSFPFASKVLMPEMAGVKEAYLGVLPAEVYLSLITDASGNIRKPLFYDNVRDFQGANAVNKEIRETLVEPSGRQRFAVLNNGVTVVTRGLQTTGNTFVMSDYQIVNGCQTSHVLFDAADEFSNDAYVPLKVISTTDEELISAIITATNRQTEVTEDDLFAMSAFQKKLESLYQAYPDKKKLYYERRSKQYASIANIEKVRIIGKTVQVRAFAAMFLDDPHRAARYYSDLRAQVGSKIFNDEHKLEPYYVSAFAHYRLEYLFRNNLLPAYYKPARYHLLMAFRYVAAGVDAPALTANKMVGYANKVADVVWVDDNALEAFKQAIVFVDAARGSEALTRDLVKTQTFTDAVRKAVLDGI